MSNKRRLNLERYGVSRQRYNELRAFCLQYPEWQAKLRDIHSLSGVSTDGEAVQGGKTGQPTESKALQSLRYIEKMNAVERALKQAVGDETNLYAPMLASLTRKIRYENLNIPISKQTYFNFRTAFFVNLDKEI